MNKTDLFECLREEILNTLPYDKGRSEIKNELEHLDIDGLTIFFLNWANRLVHPHPRRIHLSRELRERKLSPSDRIDFEDTLRRIEVGADLYPQLSRWLVHGYVGRSGIKKKNLHNHRDLDLMLNEWGIHHLHLNSQRDKRELIFVIFDREEAFLLDILPHGEWENEKLVQIAVENWPNSDLFLQIKGVLAPQVRLSTSDRKKLRSAGVNTFVQCGQKLFMSRTGGLSTAGNSTSVSLRALRLQRTIRGIADRIEANPSEFQEVFVQAKRGIPSSPEFTIKFARMKFAYGFCLFEKQTEVAIPIEVETSLNSADNSDRGHRDGL